MADADLPPELAQYLNRITVEEKAPAYLELSREGVLLSAGGSLESYGLGGLEPGKPVAEQAVHLEGFLPVGEDTLVIPSMSLGGDVFFDLHLVPGERSDWVLVMDASSEVERRRQLQQKANELALLRTRASGGGASGAIDADGERRHVAILFANLHGLTRFSEENDPKRVFRALNSYLRLIVKLVTEAAGVVDHVLGDTITATFGTLDSGEGPERAAVRAGLRILDEVGQLEGDAGAPASIAIGIASGPVSYGMVGLGERRSFSAIGYRVNMAARLESQASPREILVDEPTLEALAADTRSRFHPVTLRFRGSEEPLEAYSSLAARGG